MLPSAKRQPDRHFKGAAQCSAFALSVFNEEAQVRALIHRLEKKHTNIRKTLGDHVASVAVQANDGLITPSGNGGHRDLFESDAVVWDNRVNVLGAL